MSTVTGPAERMRVLVLSMSPVLSHRAPAVQVANMAQAFAEHGHDVTVVTPTEDPTVRDVAPEELLGFVPAFRRVALADRVHRGQSYVNALRIARIAARERPGLVHSRDLRGCLIPALRGVPTVYEAHTLSTLTGAQDRWVLRRLLRARGFRGIVAISAGLAEDLTRTLGVPPADILVAHDAVRLLASPAAPTTGGADGDLLDVGYTGSLYAGRGVELLLTVAERAPWLRLHLVGGPPDTAAALRERLAGSALAGRVVVHGLVTPARARALQAGVAVLVAPFERRVLTDSGVDSSRWMSPMKVFEYMASGRPMVISDLPVLREVLRDEVDALMVPPEDADALLGALLRLRDDPALGRRLAASARERVEAEFTWDRRAGRILARALAPRPRTVAVVLASFASGGAERVMLNLAAGMVARGVRLRMLVLDRHGPLADEVDPRVEVVDLGRRRVRTAGPRLLRELRRQDVDAVLASQTHVNALVGLLRPLLRRGTRVVLREPLLEPDAGSAVDRAIDRLLGRTDVLVASSAAMAADLSRRVGRRCPVTVVANPVAVDALRASVGPTKRAEDVHEDGSAAGTAIHAVTVARLVPQKGHADLLDALAGPVARHVQLDVVGDGPLRADLTERARRLGVADRVTFVGHVDDRAVLADRVARADVLVQPAHVEGMPNSVLEALALGTPVLATDELPMLVELAEETGPDAVRLVARHDLAAALAASTRRRGPLPAPSLLPDRFDRDRVVDRVLALLLPGDA